MVLQAAKKKLGERGLRDVVLDEARRYLEQLRSIDAPLPDTGAAEQTQAELEKAETAMWGWYLEWSRVARSTIRRRTHLKQLGFLRGGASGGDAVEDGGADEDEPAADDLEPKNPAKPG